MIAVAGVLAFGPALHRMPGGPGVSSATALAYPDAVFGGTITVALRCHAWQA